MSVMEKLPWYREYTNILKEKPEAEKEILYLEDREKQLEKLEKFYKTIGADYSRNQWLSQAEADITVCNKGKDSRLGQLRKKVGFTVILESAVEALDDDSIRVLNFYRDDRLYGELARQVMFFIGVTKARREQEFIRKAYDAVYQAYPADQADLFRREGVYYYLYYFQCLRDCITYFKGDPSYEDVRTRIEDRYVHGWLMLNPYRMDSNISGEVGKILDEIVEVKHLLEGESRL